MIQCTGIVHWRQTHGILLRTEAGYSGLCPVCDASVVQKRKPRAGQRCLAKRRAWKACDEIVYPPRQVRSRACGRKLERGHSLCREHETSRVEDIRLKLVAIRHSLDLIGKEIEGLLGKT